MPTAFTFTTEQLERIQDLRDALQGPTHMAAPAAAVPLYRYVFRCVTGLDVPRNASLDHLSSRCVTTALATLPADQRRTVLWIFGAMQINCDNGVFAEVLRQYAIRPDLMPGPGGFSNEQLQRATNQVGIVFAACILDETDIQGAPNPGQGRLPDIQDIGLGGLPGEAARDEVTRERRTVPRGAMRSPALQDMNWGQGHRLRRLAWTCTLLVVVACMSGQWPQPQLADWEPLAIDAHPLPGRWM